MAAITAQQRLRLRREFIKVALVRANQTATVNGADLDAAIDAAWAWRESTPIKSSFNGILPEPFKSIATVTQKDLLEALIASVQSGFYQFSE